MSDADLQSRMRADWNQRAKEDASYYVAFGRRHQSSDEFFSTAEEVVRGLEWEMKRLPASARDRALEIGCGPGRIMKPMSAYFAEIQGVDVSDEMVAKAKENLTGVANAIVQLSDGSTLGQYRDHSFDFVYSYAVFQHIPSKHIVLSYLRDAARVLKPGGLLRAQFSGLPERDQSDTWSGVRFTSSELVSFAREHDFQVLAIEGANTQYMWTTWRRRKAGWRTNLPELAAFATSRILRVTNANRAEPIAPAAGRFASISLWVESLPDEADITDLEVRIGGARATCTYIGPPDEKGVQQVNALLPGLEQTGLLQVELRWFEQPLGRPAMLRVIPPPPPAPRLISVSDGVNLMAGNLIESGTVKVVVEDLPVHYDFHANIDGEEVYGLERLCTDPLTQRYEFNFRTGGVEPGPHNLYLRFGRRTLPPIGIDVRPVSSW